MRDLKVAVIVSVKGLSSFYGIWLIVEEFTGRNFNPLKKIAFASKYLNCNLTGIYNIPVISNLTISLPEIKKVNPQ